MTEVAAGKNVEGICFCSRRQLHRRQKKEQCKRKRQTFVFNPEEEIWHEPYMQHLKKEFSDVSILCDSKIELPWKDIALPAAGMKIRSEVLSPLSADREWQIANEDIDGEPGKKESTGKMTLPWQDLLIMETVQSKKTDVEACDSSLEIPWSELALEKPMEIMAPPEEEPCAMDDVEIPWDDILVPQNIIIESQKKKKHPSSRYPPRGFKEGACSKCYFQCSDVKTRTGKKPVNNCANR